MSTPWLVAVLVSSVRDAVVLAVIALVSKAALRLDSVGSNARRISADTVGCFEVVSEALSGHFAVGPQDLSVSISGVLLAGALVLVRGIVDVARVLGLEALAGTTLAESSAAVLSKTSRTTLSETGAVSSCESTGLSTSTSLTESTAVSTGSLAKTTTTAVSSLSKASSTEAAGSKGTSGLEATAAGGGAEVSSES